MAAPAVQSLNDIVASLTAANQPVLDNYATQDQQVVQQGQTATAGIEGAKNTAFKDATAQAQNRGALFSGFTPDAQATYTSNTYLPALAKLQDAITASRNSVASQKAATLAGITTEAQKEQQSEQSALQAWQNAQDAAAAAAAKDANDKAFTAQQNELNRNNALAVKSTPSGNTSTTPLGSISKNAVGGLNFFDKNGNPINASAYAKLNNTSLASVLQGSNDKGDQQFVNDYQDLMSAVSSGHITPAQAQAALKSTYPNLGNITL